MKAVRIHEFGGPEIMKYEDIPIPILKNGMVLVDIHAIGVNFIDVYFRTGLYPSKPPITLGMEGAGVVSAVSEGVTEVKIGDRVAYNGIIGAYAQQASVPANRLVKLPDELDEKLAAAALLQGVTAHFLCHDTYPLKHGSRTLIHAGAGGVGLLLIQMAKLAGAYVYTTVSTAYKSQLAKEAGADKVILYVQEDFEEVIMEDTDGRGVSVVYDSVGKTTFDKSIACLEPRGFMVLYGQSSGTPDPITIPKIQAKSIYITRPGMHHYTQTREDLMERAGDVFSWVLSGKLNVHIEDTLPLRNAASAHIALEGRKTTGKVILVP